MHCQRVRSFLSAYCKDELSEKRTRAIAEHLDNCPKCRSEEQTMRRILGAARSLPQPQLPTDFNSTLLNRVAEQRHRETRSKAYLPKGIPVFTFGRVASVVATVCLVGAFIFAGGIDYLLYPDNPDMYAVETSSADGLDDSYLTVLPEADHVLTAHQSRDWTFRKQLDRATRIKQLMNRLSGETRFGSLASGTNQQGSLAGPRVFIQWPQPRTQLYLNMTAPETLSVRGVNTVTN